MTSAKSHQPVPALNPPASGSLFMPESQSPHTTCPKRRPMPILRVRTGCLTCRRRKKKCDEAKPVCRGCERNRFDCKWPRPHEIPRPRRYSPATGNVQEGATTQKERTPGREGSAGAVDIGRTVEPSMDQLLDFLVNTTDYVLPNTPFQSESSGSVTSQGCGSSPEADIAHSVGLLQDAAHAIDGAAFLPHAIDALDCAFGNVDTSTHDASDPVLLLANNSNNESNQNADETEVVPRTLSLLPGLASGSMDLLSHYLAVTAKSMDNGAGFGDPFIVQFIPIAFGSDLVLHLLLTQSAVHRATAKMIQSSDSLASDHYNQSLKLFQQGISKYNRGQTQETLQLATGALIMCFVETAKGDVHGAVFEHLMAAQWLLQAVLETSRSQLSEQLRCFLVEYYIYAASTSILSIDCRVGPQFLLADDFDAHAKTLGADYVGSLCGCWLDLLLLTPRIFNLGRRLLSHGEASPPATAEDFMEFTALNGAIQSWTPNPVARGDVSLAGRIYQKAMLVYLYTALNALASGTSGSTHATAVKDAVDRTLELLTELPPTWRVNTSLCFPIAIIGSCVYTAEHKEYLRTRLEVMFSVLGLGNIRKTAALLEKMWELRNPDPWDISPVMQQHQIWISFA